MATTKLVLRIDDLAHKLVVAESEVAVGETFDVFFADAVDWDGRTVEVLLYTFDGRLLWRLSEAVEAMTEGVEKGFGVPDCVIDTVEAAEATERGIVLVVVTVLTEGADGARTTYGAAKVKLHPGLSDDGTPLVTLHTDLEAHDSDPEAHEDIRKEIVASETEILKEVDKSLHAHAQAEAAARNEAIHSALRSTYQQVYEKLEAAMKEFAQKDVAEAVEAHAGRRDNPHEVKAEQIPVGEDVEVVANIAGADNWSTSWGFDLDLKSVNPEAWAGQDAGTVAKVSQIGLQVSGRMGTNDRVWLELTGSDGKVWTSKDTPSWAGSGEAVDYAFDPPAELPGGTMAARFVVTNGTNAGHAMPLRISKVSATETPAGCDVWTADAGTAKRTDFAPRIRDTYYTLPTTETVAMALDSLEERKLDKSGGTVTGILRMKNPKVAADDDPAHDIAVVPNAGGQGLQVQFPGGDTVILPVKRGTVATTADVDSKITAHNASEDAHEDIREKLADKAEISELVTETEAREQGDADTLDAAKAYADGKVAGAYRYKGTVATVGDLPASGNTEGDVWNVESDGMNYAWTGEAWDALGPTIDLSAYYTKTEADGRYLKLTGGTVTGITSIMGTSFTNRGWLFANNIAEGGVWIVSKYAAKTHTHAMGDVSGLDEALADKAEAEHTHEVSDVVGLSLALAAKQDKLVAGDGITIAADGKTISATGGGDVPSETALLSVSSLYDDTYIWFERKDGAAAPVIGFGFGDYSDMDVLKVASSISGGQPSVTNVPTVFGLETALAAKQDALTAGSGISISGNVISATGGGTVSFESATGESGVICRDSDTQCTLKVSRLTAEDYISISASWGTSGGGVDVPTKSYVDGLIGDIGAALAAI